MHSIKCPDCGLVNWSSEEGCKRCGAAVTTFSGAQHVTDEKSSGSLWKKLLVILFVVAAPVVALLILQKWETRHRQFAEAIENSNFFKEPVTVKASKMAGPWANVSPEALTLSEAGLLTIESEQSSVTYSTIEIPEEPASDTNPFAHRPAMSLRRVDSIKPATTHLIKKDTAATTDWQTFSDDQRSGWIVPVGARELNEITSVEKPDTLTARVHFTWHWKPNEVGRHFDFNAQEREKNAHRRPKSNPVLSSDFPFKGTAELSKTAAGWEVKSVKWDVTIPAFYQPSVSR